MEVLRGDASHKYLGKKICGDLHERAATDVNARIAASWAKWAQHRQTLVNQNISLKLRLRLFASVISPTATYGLHCATLSRAQGQKLDTTMRKMLRTVVGWRRSSDEEWAQTMRRMRVRLERGMRVFRITPWSEAIQRQQHRFAVRLAGGPMLSWARRALLWHPPDADCGRVVPTRFPGRPTRRWDDSLRSFCAPPAGVHWLDLVAQTSEDDFVETCCTSDVICVASSFCFCFKTYL